MVADVAAEPAQRVASAIGDAALAHVVDVTDPVACEAMVGAAVERFGRLDVASINAGIGGPQAPDRRCTRWTVREAGIAVNSLEPGLPRAWRAEIPAMLAGGGGAIVNMASILGSVGFARSVASSRRSTAWWA